jgi:hypothetical protein
MESVVLYGSIDLKKAQFRFVKMHLYDRSDNFLSTVQYKRDRAWHTNGAKSGLRG